MQLSRVAILGESICCLLIHAALIGEEPMRAETQIEAL